MVEFGANHNNVAPLLVPFLVWIPAGNPDEDRVGLSTTFV
jgi:hypothetical protein